MVRFRLGPRDRLPPSIYVYAPGPPRFIVGNVNLELPLLFEVGTRPHPPLNPVSVIFLCVLQQRHVRLLYSGISSRNASYTASKSAPAGPPCPGCSEGGLHWGLHQKRS